MRSVKTPLALIVAVTVVSACSGEAPQPTCGTRQCGEGLSYQECPSMSTSAPGSTVCFPYGDMMSCCFDPAYEYTTVAGQVKAMCEARIRSYCSGADLGVPPDMAMAVCNAGVGCSAVRGLYQGSTD
jgi:hypothetical protein